MACALRRDVIDREVDRALDDLLRCRCRPEMERLLFELRDNSYRDGYEKGYDEGYSVKLESEREQSYDEGFKHGYDKGHNAVHH